MQKTIDLEDLIALNDEIVALVRAGIPLDRGLASVSRDLAGRVGRIAGQLASRLQSGETLSQTLRSVGVAFPPVYVAIVEAGIEAGRLGVALETVAGSTRRLAEARRTVVAALTYPLFVFLLAWGLFVLFICRIAGALLVVFEGANVPAAGLLELMVPFRETAIYWGPAVPIAAILVFVVWAYRSSRATLLQPAVAGTAFGWFPWLGAMIEAYRQAAFAEVLHLLVKQDIAVPRAIRLAAEATCAKGMRTGAEQIADAIERGERLGGAVQGAEGFSPVLEWLLRSGHDRGTLQTALSHAADVYGRQAKRRATSAQLYLPPLLTFAIGGTVTLAYVALTFGTWLALLRSITKL